MQLVQNMTIMEKSKTFALWSYDKIYSFIIYGKF